MKDKRQRQTFAWPYAAVYADPNFAASLLQAAATSVAMPYGYAPNPMLPQMPVMPTQMQQTAAVAAYSYGYRYAQYPIPQRSNTNAVPHAHQIPPNLTHTAGYPVLNNMTQGYTPLSIPKVQTPPSELMESPTSPESSLSLSPLSLASGKMNSPHKENNAHHGLLMTAPARENKHELNHHQHSHHHHQHQHQHHNQIHLQSTNYEQTTIVKSEKPKLFKPYKSEE